MHTPGSVVLAATATATNEWGDLLSISGLPVREEREKCEIDFLWLCVFFFFVCVCDGTPFFVCVFLGGRVVFVGCVMSGAGPDANNGSEVHEDQQQKEEGCKCTTYEENFFRVCPVFVFFLSLFVSVCV